MPYITQGARARLAQKGQMPKTAGELNYRITSDLLNAWSLPGDEKSKLLLKLSLLASLAGYTLSTIGPMGKISYNYINTVIGAMQSAGMEFIHRTNADPATWPLQVLAYVEAEFYRRIAIPYENKKIKENGDIPGFAYRPPSGSAGTGQDPNILQQEGDQQWPASATPGVL